MYNFDIFFKLIFIQFITHIIIASNVPKSGILSTVLARGHACIHEVAKFDMFLELIFEVPIGINSL